MQGIDWRGYTYQAPRVCSCFMPKPNEEYTQGFIHYYSSVVHNALFYTRLCVGYILQVKKKL